MIPDFDRYKLVVFPGLFRITPEKRAILEQYVLKNGRHVLWMYAPGIWNEAGLDPANCTQLTGVPYGYPELSVQPMDGWVSCYLHSYEALTPAVLQQLAVQSGVRMTVQDPLPVYAEGDLLALHTAEGGVRTVYVDSSRTEAEELFTGQRFPVENGQFRYPFAEPDTALFLLR